MRDRLGGFAGAEQRRAEADARFRVSRLQLDSGAIVAGGLLELAVRGERVAEIGLPFREAGTQAHRRREMLARLARAALALEHHAETVVDDRFVAGRVRRRERQR